VRHEVSGDTIVWIVEKDLQGFSQLRAVRIRLLGLSLLNDAIDLEAGVKNG
jgi:hypothetical protein